MAIKTIDILNIMVFQRHWRYQNRDVKDVVDAATHEDFHLDFVDGINVIIGENGVGKTTLLKMIYAATQWSNKQIDAGKTKQLLQFFSSSLNSNGDLKNAEYKDGYCYYKVSDGTHSFEDSLTHNGGFNDDQWLGLDISSVFIPTTEMLSHSKGFLALNQKYHMPFDQTQVDIIVNASLPETREIPESMKGILDKISKVIDGTVVMEDDSFYVVKKDGRKVDFSLEAEGLRKLGLLWKLIRNGLLGKGAILLWDEPEANLNPELYPLVADILLELCKNGVQIFVATHSYNFAKYIEIRRIDKEQVLFHNIYKKENVIYSQSAYRMEDTKPNHIMMADDKLLDEVYNM